MIEAGSAREGGDNGSHEAASSCTPLIEVQIGKFGGTFWKEFMTWVAWVVLSKNFIVSELVESLSDLLLGSSFGRAVRNRASMIGVPGSVVWCLLSINCSCHWVCSMMLVC